MKVILIKSKAAIAAHFFRNFFIGIGFMIASKDFTPFVILGLFLILLFEILITYTAKLTIEGETAHYKDMFSNSTISGITAVDFKFGLIDYLNTLTIKGQGSAILSVTNIDEIDEVQSLVNKFHSKQTLPLIPIDTNDIPSKLTERKILQETIRHLLRTGNEEKAISLIREKKEEFTGNLALTISIALKMFEEGKEKAGKDLLEDILQI